MAKEWEFISIGEHGKTNHAETRKKIRENAMRDFRRNERLARMREYARHDPAAAGTPPSTVQNSSVGQDEESPDEDTVRSESLSVPDRSGNLLVPAYEMQIAVPRGPGSAADPFSSTALPRDRDAPWLLEHFLTKIATQLQPHGSTRSRNTLNAFLAQTAQEDFGAISSLLFHASLHFDSFKGRRGHWSRLTLHHYGETVRILNQRLDAQEATTDASILMVGFLASTGNITGNVASDEAHWSALQTMIDMRGGLDTLGWKGALALILMVGDNIHATVSSTRPRLKPMNISANPLLASLPQEFTTPSRPISSLSSYTAEIHTLMLLNRHLSALQLAIFADANVSMATVLSFTQLCIAVEHRALSLDVPSSIQTTSSSEEEIQLLLSTASHITILLLTSFIFRAFTPNSPTFASLHARLKPVLDALIIYLLPSAPPSDPASQLPISELSISQSQPPFASTSPSHSPSTSQSQPQPPSPHKTLLWILWTATLTSAPPQQAPYITPLVSLTRDLRINKWAQVHSVLERHVWSVRLEGGRCWDVCASVGISAGGDAQGYGQGKELVHVVQ